MNAKHIVIGIMIVFFNSLISYCQFSHFTVLDHNYDHDKLLPYKFLDTQKSSYIVFVQDEDNNHYVVKQEKGNTIKRQFRAISEAICAYIARMVGVPAHEVEIIPAGVAFPGKFIAKRVATLHTLVPGNTIRSKPNEQYGKLDIKQNTDSHLSYEHQGLTTKTIFWMSQHRHLPLVVALDTFLGNKDRNKANILYDPVTDTFYAIDMALMYDILGERRLVSTVACQQVKKMIDLGTTFTAKEYEALGFYRSTLEKLVQVFPPSVFTQLIDDLFQQSGICATTLEESQEIEMLMLLYKRAIKQSYVEIKKLLYLLSLLLKK